MNLKANKRCCDGKKMISHCFDDVGSHIEVPPFNYLMKFLTYQIPMYQYIYLHSWLMFS